MTKIKICGLFRECDIDYVNEAKPDFIGFVFAPSRRQVSPEWAAVLRSRLKPGVTPVGVFVNEELTKVARLCNEQIIDMVQLHGDETEEYIQKLQRMIHRPVIKAVRVLARGDIEAIQDSAADFLLLDSGSGGTGKTFDWRLAGQVKSPFFLAGGLNTGNIDQAIAATRPYAVDLSSGAETDGLKNREKILEIVRRVRNG